MAIQYWVNDFFIDLSRNQITRHGQSQTLAPKALAVLTCLAENQGKVISQDELLTEVWQRTVVSSNTLQRSIAQLRKALDDDGRGQACIKTHAKRGYSLECEVRWLKAVDSTGGNRSWESTDIDRRRIQSSAQEDYGVTSITPEQSVSRPGIRMLSITAGIIMLAAFGFWYPEARLASPLTFDQLRILTATDDKEFDATYTPDGQYVVFSRYRDNQCINRIWAKNLLTQEETLLTEEWGAYGSHSLSGDGKQLVFLAHAPCTEPLAQRLCYDLMSLDFEQALEGPQQPSLMLQCRHTDVRSPKWLGNDNIALLQTTSNRWKLINYSVSRNESTDIYQLRDGNLIDFDYSAKDDLVAVTSIHGDGRQYIDMLKPDGRQVSSHPINFPHASDKLRPIYPTYDALNEQLIFSTGKQLYTLSYEGDVVKINLPYAEPLVPAQFHPDGRRLLLIKGPYDSDIARVSRSQITATNPLSASYLMPSHESRSYPVLERSNLSEGFAVFQPGGQLVAFWSERSGEEQLWISDGQSPRQLTRFPLDTVIRGIAWAADGNSLLVNADRTLIEISLDSNQQTLSMPYAVVRLYQWDSENSKALVLTSVNGIYTLMEYDLETREARVVSDKQVLWAQTSEDGQLIIKDDTNRFWQPGPAEAQPIPALDGQGSRSKSFVVKGSVIYAINEENQLWAYDLEREVLDILGEVDPTVDHLTDINADQILMTVQVAAKQEVVELSLMVSGRI